MGLVVEPPNSMLLIAGRDDFTVPADFDGATCVATADCIAVGVISVDDGPTSISIVSAVTASTDLTVLDSFMIETSGRVSVQSVYGVEYDGLSIAAGAVKVTVWADDRVEPSRIELHVEAQ